jgi:hypothetical protein
MTELVGQIIASPMLKFGNKDIKVNNGSWNAQFTRFYDPKSISKWVVYVFDNGIRFDQISGFVQEFKKIAVGHGIKINDPVDILSPDYSEWGRDPFRFLEKEVRKIKPEFIMAVLQDRSPVYG